MIEDKEITKIPEEPTNQFDPIDFTIFKDEILDDFEAITTKTKNKTENETKTLILSKYLFPKFNFIFKTADLQKCGFSPKIYYLENCPQKIEEDLLVFMISPKTECIDLVVTQFDFDMEELKEKQKNISDYKCIKEKKYFFIYVPKIDSNILNYTNSDKLGKYRALFDEYCGFEFINFPLDFDLISFEDNNAFKELYLYKFSNCIDNLANLLIKIQELYGKIKYKYILGENAQKLSNLLTQKENEGFISGKNKEEILACFFLDRSIDYITPFCTEYTYEALINENFGIKFDRVKIKSEILNSSEENSENKKNSINNIKKEEYKTLNLKDKFFYMIKDFHFDKIRYFLSKRLSYQRNQVQQLKDSKNYNDISQGIQTVQKIKSEEKNMNDHINLADYFWKKFSTPEKRRRLQFEQQLLGGNKDCIEYIHEYYETEMARKSDPYELLKLFCLENLVCGNVKYKIYDSFKNDFLMTYDENYYFLLKNLEELKILRKNGNTKFYQNCYDKLGLISENINVNNPNDASYVFGGFCPISIRLIENAFTKGWGFLNKDFLKNFGECYFPENEKPIIESTYENNFILLVFIGGITYSELAAIRYFNSKKNTKYKFLVITTKVINGNSFFDDIKSDDFELAIDMSDKVVEKKSIEKDLNPKLLKKLKEEDEKYKSKIDKIDQSKKKEMEDRKKEVEKMRNEWNDVKNKDK